VHYNDLTGQQQSPSSKVFINYYKKDGSYAQRLYSDLRAANLDAWIDKENLLPGQSKSDETEKAIRKSNYFVALLSTVSVQERGDSQRQINTALDVLKEIPGSDILFIPAVDHMNMVYCHVYF
jgi:hypothetical protein